MSAKKLFRNRWVAAGMSAAELALHALYIEGKVELKDLNMAANCGFEVAHPAEERASCSGEGVAD